MGDFGASFLPLKNKLPGHCTDGFHVPLLHFGDVSPNNTYYSAAFTFMSGESEEDFYWAIDQFKRRIRFDLEPPKCFITDNDKGMRKALSQVFYVPQMLCSWHIRQNVLHHVKLTWRLADYVEGSEERTKAKEQQDLLYKGMGKGMFMNVICYITSCCL
jgi:MULE transposase-like protein